MKTIANLENLALTTRLQADAAERKALDLEQRHKQAKLHAKAARQAYRKARKAAKQAKRLARDARREADVLLADATEAQKKFAKARQAARQAKARKRVAVRPVAEPALPPMKSPVPPRPKRLAVAKPKAKRVEEEEELVLPMIATLQDATHRPNVN
jgi:chromosome segregation ATPase